jgi:hypothetical protein
VAGAGVYHGPPASLLTRKDILVLLEGGDRRSIGRAEEVAAMVAEDAKLFPQLIAGLRSDKAVVRMRAADAAEKVTRERGELLQPYKKELLGLMAAARDQEVRWHLAVMVPRLRLSDQERAVVLSALNGYLEDRSSMVRTFALQGIADLAREHAVIREKVVEILRVAGRSGTAAMKARSRKLLKGLESIQRPQGD